jgi:hypothetical protein
VLSVLLHTWYQWYTTGCKTLRRFIKNENCKESTVFVLKSAIFWDITLCSPLSVKQRFRWTYCLHLQGQKNKLSEKPARKQVAACLPPALTLASCSAHSFDPEDGGDMFPWNVGWHSTDYTVMVLFITTAVRTYNPTQLLYSLQPCEWCLILREYVSKEKPGVNNSPRSADPHSLCLQFLSLASGAVSSSELRSCIHTGTYHCEGPMDEGLHACTSTDPK